MKLTLEDQSKLRDKTLANVIRKLNAGKTPTAREQAILDAATAGEGIDATGYVGTWDELGQRLGVTRRAIHDWRNDPRYEAEIKKRWPKLERADGRKCVAEWLRLMIDLHLKRGAATAEMTDAADDDGDVSGGTIQPPRYGGSQGDWTKAKIAKDVERKDIEIESIKGSLLEATELEVPLGATFAVIQTKLAQFPARVARYLVGLRDVGEVEDRLRDELDADLSDLHSARFTAEDAVAAAVAAVPFDEETKELCKTLLFAGSDHNALLGLASAIATDALRRLGQRALQHALHSAITPDIALADAATSQVTEPAEDREHARRVIASSATVAASGASEPARAEKVSGKIAVSKSAALPLGKSKGKKTKARIKTAVGPAEVEASIVTGPIRKKKRRR